MNEFQRDVKSITSKEMIVLKMPEVLVTYRLNKNLICVYNPAEKKT